MIQTQTIDIQHVKKILENCPHYDMIVNYEYPYGDVLSKKLIDWYRELIFSANGNDENQLLLIKALDKSLYLYVKDNKYKLARTFLLVYKEEYLKENGNKLIDFVLSEEGQNIVEENGLIRIK